MVTKKWKTHSPEHTPNGTQTHTSGSAARRPHRPHPHRRCCPLPGTRDTPGTASALSAHVDRVPQTPESGAPPPALANVGSCVATSTVRRRQRPIAYVGGADAAATGGCNVAGAADVAAVDPASALGWPSGMRHARRVKGSTPLCCCSSRICDRAAAAAAAGGAANMPSRCCAAGS